MLIAKTCGNSERPRELLPLYLDEHSELKMEEFGSVALEALEKAWPCK